MKELVQSNIDRDLRELCSYRDGFVTAAALAEDAGWPMTAQAYLQVVLLLEQAIQGLGTIPHLGELPGD